MTNTTALGLTILLAALALGVLGDALLRATPWGVDAPLFAAALLVTALAIARRRGVCLVGGGRWLAAPALGFAAVFAWRDSAALIAFNVLALAAAATLFAFRARQGRVRVAGLVDYVGAAAHVGVHAGLGALGLLFSDVAWRALPGGRPVRVALAVLGGFALAAPLLILFGLLFASADVVFGRLVFDLARWLAEWLTDHVVAAGLVAWIVAGYLRQALVAGEARLALERPPALALGVVELGVALGLLDALFLTFVAVQVRYLFGGADLVAIEPGLTYAEYARRGFFELVAVAALVVPVLLAADWLLRRERPRDERVLRALAGLLVGLVGLVVASAVQRMRIYQDVFGLTELRLYTTAVMAWIALVLVWLVLTVLRGRRDRFAFGALVAGFAIVGTLDLLDPDALIARTNLTRAGQGASFDAHYASELSGDAVPTLVAALPTLPADQRSVVASRLLSAWGDEAEPDWRTWNLARARARAAVAPVRGELAGAAAAAPAPPTRRVRD